ncbi:MAG: nucleotide exchange factor GrpE [Dongiaceae bacterium]
MTDEKRDNGAEAPIDEPSDMAAANDSATPDPLAEAQGEAARLKDQLLRALAETENLRRRSQREREDTLKFAATEFAKEMLPVADNLGRALDAIPAGAAELDPALKALQEGVAATARQLEAAFERQGIRRIDPMGQKFDSNLHQAMFEVPGSGQPAGTVVQVLQPGYVLNERLLRAAMVGVAKAEPKAAEAPAAGSGFDTLA